MTPNYTVSIQTDSPVFKLYQRLKADGVKDADLDTGYPQTDYVKKTRKTVHKGDHKIDETEVLNYALEHYERYQLAIKETTGYIVPWSLDDLNSATDFDAKVREKVSSTIAVFKKVLNAKGLKEGTDRYNELMAVSLFAFSLSSSSSMWMNAKLALDKEGLKEVLYYLAQNSGLTAAGFSGNCKSQATALEAIAQSCGWCSELSVILYAVFRAAGLKARITYVKPGYKFNRAIRTEIASLHQSLSLELGSRVRIFDPALKQADAEAFYKKYGFIWWFPQTGVEALSSYYSNLGTSFHVNGNKDQAFAAYEKSLKLDPNHLIAHIDLGDLYLQKDDNDRAIAEYMIALRLDPNYPEAYYNLGVAYDQKKDPMRAIAEYKTALKLNPEYLHARVNLGTTFLEIGKLEQGHAEFIAAVRLDPSEARAWLGLGNSYSLQAKKDLKEDKQAEALPLLKNALEAFNKAKEKGMALDPGPIKNLQRIIEKLEGAGVRAR